MRMRMNVFVMVLPHVCLSSATKEIVPLPDLALNIVEKTGHRLKHFWCIEDRREVCMEFIEQNRVVVRGGHYTTGRMKLKAINFTYPNTQIGWLLLTQVFRVSTPVV
jgi:hypothetical protein